MQLTLYRLLVDQLSTLPPVESVDLNGKTVVVVGANVGIGFEATKHFARMNPARLVLGCRSVEKGDAAASNIASATGYQSCKVGRIDLADFRSVVDFADWFRREHDRLDILVMNAGMVPSKHETTKDGWESTLQVNHLGTVLLSLLLVPSLVDTGRKFGCTSRLVIVSSATHYWADLPEDVKKSSSPIALLNSPKYGDDAAMRRRYAVSKLMNVFFAQALQTRLQSITPLTVNAVNPGFCYSNLRQPFQGTLLGLKYAIQEVIMAWTSEQGSRQLIYAAIGARDDEDRMKGAYVNRAAVVEPSDFVISEEGKHMQDNVWRETIEILSGKAPQLKSIVQEYLV